MNYPKHLLGKETDLIAEIKKLKKLQRKTQKNYKRTNSLRYRCFVNTIANQVDQKTSELHRLRATRLFGTYEDTLKQDTDETRANLDAEFDQDGCRSKKGGSMSPSRFTTANLNNSFRDLPRRKYESLNPLQNIDECNSSDPNCSKKTNKKGFECNSTATRDMHRYRSTSMSASIRETRSMPSRIGNTPKRAGIPQMGYRHRLHTAPSLGTYSMADAASSSPVVTDFSTLNVQMSPNKMSLVQNASNSTTDDSSPSSVDTISNHKTKNTLGRVSKLNRLRRACSKWTTLQNLKIFR